MALIGVDQKIKQAVETWREGNYQGTSPITKRLLELWFREEHIREPEGAINPIDEEISPKPKREEEAVYDSLRTQLSHIILLTERIYIVKNNIHSSIRYLYFVFMGVFRIEKEA